MSIVIMRCQLTSCPGGVEEAAAVREVHTEATTALTAATTTTATKAVHYAGCKSQARKKALTERKTNKTL